MTTREAFEQQLDANPSDWGTRMIYADWLEENNDDHGATVQRWMASEKVKVEYREKQKAWFIVLPKSISNVYLVVLCGWTLSGGGLGYSTRFALEKAFYDDNQIVHRLGKEYAGTV